jgi:hypothetical protein
VALELQCVDRLYLNAYVPSLQVGGQVVRFITQHLGKPIPSAALLGAIDTRFRREVKAFADAREIPILALKRPDRSRWDDRKIDHVRPYLERAERERRYGVVAIVACQEFQWVISARNRATKPKAVCFEFLRRSAASASTGSASLRQRRCSSFLRSGARACAPRVYAPDATRPAECRFRWSSDALARDSGAER